MKNPTPELVARIAALIIAVLLLVMLVLIKVFLIWEINWWIVLLAPLIIFFGSFLIVSYMIELFVYRKIKLIYKRIYDTKSVVSVRPSRLRMKKNILDDVTEEVEEWQESTKKRQKKMRALDSFRKEFIANVFHELKTPVFNIQGYLETLIEGAINDEKVKLRFLKKANHNADRIASIVNDLQLISNLEEGSFELDLMDFDVTELVREVFESMEMAAKKTSIGLGIKEGCNKVFRVKADRDMIRQVLSNLIMNSLKYGKQKGTTQVGLYDMGEQILVEVTDTGIGIEKEHVPRIFERFYRVDKDRSRQQGGSGLGLSIVKHIVERHEMTMNVRSTPGVGTTFGFTLAKA